MHLQLTLALFAALTAALLLLRLAWPRLSHSTHRAILIVAGLALPLWPLSLLTRWSFTADRLDGLLTWAFIAAYELLVLLLTLLRPRWLTALIAFTLILPLLSASAFLPLTELFDRAPETSLRLGPNLYSQRVPWNFPRSNVSGTDLEIFYRPARLPLLQHRAQGARYYNTQCDANHAFATLQPDGLHLQMNCPALPDQPGSARTLIVRLR